MTRICSDIIIFTSFSLEGSRKYLKSRYVVRSLYCNCCCLSCFQICLVNGNPVDFRRFCIHHIRLHRIGGIFSFGCPLCIRTERHTQHHRGCQQHRQRLLVFHFCHASCFLHKTGIESSCDSILLFILHYHYSTVFMFFQVL